MKETGRYTKEIDSQNMTKKSMIYHGIRDEIKHGIYKSEERILISDVAEKYGVSIIPVREAFQTLAQEGLLVSRPNIGYFVSKISQKDVEDIFDVRLSLETLAARLAIAQINSEGIELLADMIEDSRSFLEKEEYKEYWNLNRKWHFAFYEFSNNSQLLRILSELYDCSSRYPDYYQSKSEIETSIEDHIQILNAIKEKDVDFLEALIRVHTIESKKHYLERLHTVLGDNLEK